MALGPQWASVHLWRARSAQLKQEEPHSLKQEEPHSLKQEEPYSLKQEESAPQCFVR